MNEASGTRREKTPCKASDVAPLVDPSCGTYKTPIIHVSRDQSHSAPRTQASADILPLNSPHSKSFNHRFSRPYLSSMRWAALLASSRIGFCPSVSGSSPFSIRAEPELMSVPPDFFPEFVVSFEDGPIIAP